MKAILLKVLPQTDTKPRRYKAQAEGVPAIVRCSYDRTPRQVAVELCERYGWPEDLIEGTLPNGDTVFVFDPYTKVLRAGQSVSNALYNVGQGTEHKARCLELVAEWDAARKEVRDVR